jgi:hypothetical protein
MGAVLTRSMMILVMDAGAGLVARACLRADYLACALM